MKDIKKGDTGIITFGDGSTTKVIIEDIQSYPSSGMPADVFFKYQEGETNKQIKHPTFGDTFPIPMGLVSHIFTKD